MGGEAVESKTFLFNGEITGPAITHLAQVNPTFWLILGVGIARERPCRQARTFARRIHSRKHRIRPSWLEARRPRRVFLDANQGASKWTSCDDCRCWLLGS